MPTTTRAELPLEAKVAMVLALKGRLTAAQLAELSRPAQAVTEPEPRGCQHPPGTAKTPSGRCVECKRAADRRHYAKAKAGATSGLAEILVRKGLAALEPDGTLTYKGQVIAPPRKPPALPLDLPDALAEHLRRAGLTMPRTRADAAGAAVACDAAEQRARTGQRARYHDSCSYCTALIEVVREEHRVPDQFTGISPRDLARAGRRHEYHDNCYICLEFETEATSERLEYRRRQRYAAEPARHANGRDIRSDGTLCRCAECSDRARVVQERAQGEALRARLAVTPSQPPLVWQTGTIGSGNMTVTINGDTTSI